MGLHWTCKPISTSTPISPPHHLPTVTLSEKSSLQITTTQLNSKKFLQWSRSALMVVRGRGYLGYVTGTSLTPAESDPAYVTWDAQNSKVMASTVKFNGRGY